MPSIKFSHEWDKLFCEVGSVFTTIRRSYGSKGEYYRNLTGTVLDVEVNGEKRFSAELLQVFRGKGSDLSGALLKYDTDGDGSWMDKISAMEEVLVLIFRRVGA